MLKISLLLLLKFIFIYNKTLIKLCTFFYKKMLIIFKLNMKINLMKINLLYSIN